MEPLQMRPGIALGPCLLGDFIGRGTNGVVFQAHHATLASPVAVKVMLPAPALPATERAVLLARFRRASERGALLHHPCILPVLDYGEQDGLSYQIVPYRSRGSLYEVVQATGPLPLETVMGLLTQVSGALTYAHERETIHGAITPCNFLVLDTSSVQLADFGLGVVPPLGGKMVLQQDGTHPSRKFPYLAPEQLLGENPNVRSDVYALGAVLFYLLTALAPYEGSSPNEILLQQVRDIASARRSALLSMPEACEKVILRAMAQLPDERFESIADVVTAFRAALSEAPSSRKRSEGPTEVQGMDGSPHASEEPSVETHASGEEGATKRSEDEAHVDATASPDPFPLYAPPAETTDRGVELPGARSAGVLASQVEGTSDDNADTAAGATATPEAILPATGPLGSPPGARTTLVRAVLSQLVMKRGRVSSRLPAICVAVLLLAVLLVIGVYAVNPAFLPGHTPRVQVGEKGQNSPSSGQPAVFLPLATTGGSSYIATPYSLSSSGHAPSLAFFLSAPLGPSLAVSVTVQERAGDNTEAETAFGLLFHCSSASEGDVYQACYSFEISPVGTYQFWKYDARALVNRVQVEPSSWTQVWRRPAGSEYHKGYGTRNSMTVIDRGGTFTLLINGRDVGIVSDVSLPAGVVGLVVRHPGTQVLFSHLVITRSLP